MKARTVIDVGQNLKDYDGAFEGNYVKIQKYILEKISEHVSPKDKNI